MGVILIRRNKREEAVDVGDGCALNKHAANILQRLGVSEGEPAAFILKRGSVVKFATLGTHLEPNDVVSVTTSYEAHRLNEDAPFYRANELPAHPGSGLYAIHRVKVAA